MNAIDPFVPTRSRETIHADIEAQHKVVNMLWNLATDFIKHDIGPLIFDGTSVERIGPYTIPPKLLKWLDFEGRKLAVLEHELRMVCRSER